LRETVGRVLEAVVLAAVDFEEAEDRNPKKELNEDETVGAPAIVADKEAETEALVVMGAVSVAPILIEVFLVALLKALTEALAGVSAAPLAVVKGETFLFEVLSKFGNIRSIDSRIMRRIYASRIFCISWIPVDRIFNSSKMSTSDNEIPLIVYTCRKCSNVITSVSTSVRSSIE
jgi:hypothetical protein